MAALILSDAEFEAAAQQVHYELGITITAARIVMARVLAAVEALRAKRNETIS